MVKTILFFNTKQSYSGGQLYLAFPFVKSSLVIASSTVGLHEEKKQNKKMKERIQDIRPGYKLAPFVYQEINCVNNETS